MEGTGDDLIFTKLKAVPELLAKRWPMTESDRSSWQSIEDKLSVKGNALRLDFTATLEDSPSTRRFQLVVSPGGSRPLRSWAEN
jgi:hypothetical protein